MAAHSSSAIPDPDCCCSNISIMQLFHELKQKFPAVPDRVVSECIRQNFHDKASCEAILQHENQAYLLHSYPNALKMSCCEQSLTSRLGSLGMCAHHHQQEEKNVRQCPQAGQDDQSGPADGNVPKPHPRPTSLDIGRSREQQQQRLHEPRSAPVVASSFDPFVNKPLSFPEELPDSYEFNVNCSMQRSPTGSTVNVGTRVRSSVTLAQTPHFAPLHAPSTPGQPPRSYTSVNLTLRPPTSEPQPPIDIRSAGTSLTYSTSSYDPRQGYQSQLRISIGPGGAGSVSAQRTRVPVLPSLQGVVQATTVPSSVAGPSEEEVLHAQVQALSGGESFTFTQDLLVRQLDRKNKLERALKREQEKLAAMQAEARSMENDLARRQQKRPPLAQPISTIRQKVQILRQEIHQLQEECKKMTQVVDLSFVDARVPLGETDEEFYKNIYTGQRVVLSRQNATPRERPHLFASVNQEVEINSDGPNWTCSECTFRNHPLLDKCEQCEMPRIVLGTDGVAGFGLKTAPTLSLPN